MDSYSVIVSTKRTVTILELYCIGIGESQFVVFVGVFDDDEKMNVAEFEAILKHRSNCPRAIKTTVTINEF